MMTFFMIMMNLIRNVRNHPIIFIIMAVAFAIWAYGIVKLF